MTRFGTWPSPLDAETLASTALRLASPAFAPGGDGVLWLEGRPAEGGRTVLVHAPARDAPTDLTPAPLDLRSRVHEYGGGAFTVLGEALIFVDVKTGAIHLARPGEAARVLAAPGSEWRFGDLTADPAHGRVLAVAEVHRNPPAPPENLLVAIDVETGALEILVAGADFYASPAPSPDGRQLAWLSWNHPHLPWDAAALHLGELDRSGRPRAARHVAGDATGSAQQPAFARDGTLYFLLEADGYWNLFRLGPDDRATAVAPMPGSELGLPPWQLGTRTWAFADDGTVIAAAVTAGETSLVEIDLATGATLRLPAAVAQVAHLAAHGNEVVMQAGLVDRPGGIVRYRRAEQQLEVLRPTLPLTLDPAFVARAEPIEFATSEGDKAYGFFYPPRNPNAAAPPGERPPLIVIAHGGPTAAASPAFNPLVQFWTTRGLAVLDVNYRGSTGYGRAFRDRLRGQWGIYDVDDCIAGARALAAAGRVDPARLAIRGSSAGGFTALAALTSRGAFHAGASLYGISDLSALAKDTHKFESRYLDGLIGPWPARQDLYRARSPLFRARDLAAPVIFFQGEDDKVVPPDQAARMVAALADNQIAAELHSFAGEQHGFRRAETLRTVYLAELGFYARVFGFAAP